MNFFLFQRRSTMLEQEPVASLPDRIFSGDTAAATDSPAAAPTAAVPSRLAAKTPVVVITRSRLAAAAAAAEGTATMASATSTRTRVGVRFQCYYRYSGV